MVKYPEANRMHKKMMALSHLCRSQGNPQEPRRAIGRAQCNDVYWHGVFGGLYLRHLRDPIWANLAEAEGLLRQGQGLVWEERDLDLDGHTEIWVHSSSFSALISPERGGAVEELTLFEPRVNLANTLTRRREAYHEPNGDDAGNGPDSGTDTNESEADRGTPSIHDLEEGLRFSELPPVDQDDRALFLERILPGDLKLDAYQKGEYEPLWSWTRETLKVDGIHHLGQDDGSSAGDQSDGEGGLSSLKILLSHDGPGRLWKEILLEEGGTLTVQYRWDPAAFPGHSRFSAELSLGADAEVETSEDAETWRFPISTFSKSERGFDETVQGESVTVRWPVRAGEGWIRLSVG
jgi:alpha-amylase